MPRRRAFWLAEGICALTRTYCLYPSPLPLPSGGVATALALQRTAARPTALKRAPCVRRCCPLRSAVAPYCSAPFMAPHRVRRSLRSRPALVPHAPHLATHQPTHLCALAAARAPNYPPRTLTRPRTFACRGFLRLSATECFNAQRKTLRSRALSLWCSRAKRAPPRTPSSARPAPLPPHRLGGRLATRTASASTRPFLT